MAYVIPSVHHGVPITAVFTNAPLGLILQAIADVAPYHISVLDGGSALIFRDLPWRPVEGRFIQIPAASLRAIGIKDIGSRKELFEWFVSRGVTPQSYHDVQYLPEIGALLLTDDPREVEIMSALLRLELRAVDPKRDYHW